jgi:anaerobic selenocysteine-containing dehydrogenase
MSRALLHMHKDDMERRSLNNGDLVEVKSRAARWYSR